MLREYVPRGPAESRKTRAFAEEKLLELLQSDVLADRQAYLRWMESLTREYVSPLIY